MKSIVFEMSDCGVWYAEVHVPAKGFHSFEQSGRCVLGTHISQTIWFPMGAVAEVICGDRVIYGMVTGVRASKEMAGIEVAMQAIDEEGFDCALRGSFLCGNDLN